MRFALSSGFTVTIGVLLIAGCSGDRREEKKAAPPKGGSPFETFTETTPKAGEMAPAFELMDADGRW